MPRLAWVGTQTGNGYDELQLLEATGPRNGFPIRANKLIGLKNDRLKGESLT